MTSLVRGPQEVRVAVFQKRDGEASGGHTQPMLPEGPNPMRNCILARARSALIARLDAIFGCQRFQKFGSSPDIHGVEESVDARSHFGQQIFLDGGILLGCDGQELLITAAISFHRSQSIKTGTVRHFWPLVTITCLGSRGCIAIARAWQMNDSSVRRFPSSPCLLCFPHPSEPLDRETPLHLSRD
jgi:hypothetical protein